MLLSAVFRPRDPQAQASASLQAWARGSIPRGVADVQARLDRLRRAGVIDVDGKRVVELPSDMLPDSLTDV
jgi:hypothetical protein